MPQSVLIAFGCFGGVGIAILGILVGSYLKRSHEQRVKRSESLEVALLEVAKQLGLVHQTLVNLPEALAADSRAATTEFRLAVAALLEHTGKIIQHAEVQEKFTEGLIKITQEEVAVLGDVKLVVDELKGSLFGGDRDRDNRGYRQFSEQEASREGEIQELMDKGLPRSEAEVRVNSVDLWSRVGKARRG